MAFTITNLVFIDRMQFMNSSLDALIKNLSDNDFKNLSEYFSGEFLKLVKEKRMYYMNTWIVLKYFLKIKYLIGVNFFSSLKYECISEKDYLASINVWNVFKMNTIGDYYDFYLKTDFPLLADVFEKFISTCFDYYRLDSCYYFSSPGLSWHVMLKMPGLELELISDISMYFFIEKGIRGISYIAKRHSKANNKYIKCYDSGK